MYVYEFLWRGRPNGETAYHVILANEQNLFGEVRHVESNVLTPAQAEAQGFPLAAVLADINAAALKARDAAIADKTKAEQERDQAIAEKAVVEAERDQAIAALAEPTTAPSKVAR